MEKYFLLIGKRYLFSRVNFFSLIVFLIFFLSYISEDRNDTSLVRNEIISSFKKYESEKYLGYKSSKLEITDDGFIRYKKVLANNKSEYYSVRLEKLLEINYLGTEKTGWLLISCEPSSVIFQTYSDPSGDVDSMTHVISFPLSNVSVADLNLIRNNFQVLKNNFGKNVK